MRALRSRRARDCAHVVRACDSFLRCPVQSPVSPGHFGIALSVGKTMDAPASALLGSGVSASGAPPASHRWPGAPVNLTCVGRAPAPAHGHTHSGTARPPEGPPQQRGWVADPPVPLPTYLRPQHDLRVTVPDPRAAGSNCRGGRGQGGGGMWNKTCRPAPGSLHAPPAA